MEELQKGEQSPPPPGTQMRFKGFRNGEGSLNSNGPVHIVASALEVPENVIVKVDEQRCETLSEQSVEESQSTTSDTSQKSKSSAKSQIFKVARLTARRLSGLKDFVSDLTTFKRKDIDIKEKDTVDQDKPTTSESIITSKRHSSNYGSSLSSFAYKYSNRGFWRPNDNRASKSSGILNRSTSSYNSTYFTTPPKPRPSHISLRSFYAFGAKSGPLLNKGFLSSMPSFSTIKDRSLSSGYSSLSVKRPYSPDTYDHTVLQYSRYRSRSNSNSLPTYNYNIHMSTREHYSAKRTYSHINSTKSKRDISVDSPSRLEPQSLSKIANLQPITEQTNNDTQEIKESEEVVEDEMPRLDLKEVSCTEMNS